MWKKGFEIMNMIEHTHLEEWAVKLGGTAILGFICTLLIAGKFLHHVFQHRGLVCGYLIVPPAMLSGLLGLLWFIAMDYVDPVFTRDLGDGLSGVRINLINFVFAALILGLTSTSSSSQHLASLRGIITSLLHEGMPMVIYSQILIWGHSTVCLFALCVMNSMGAEIPALFAAVIPLGIEAGTDIVVTPISGAVDVQTVVEESESLGLVAACVMGIFLISSKPFFLAKGYLSGLGGVVGSISVSSVQQGAGQAEHFERGRSMHSMHRSFSQGQLGMDRYGFKSSNDESESKGERQGFASLGAHLSLIALTVFMSFGVSLSARLAEIELGLPVMLSGVRLFKVSMFCALIAMQFIVRRSRIKFKREWFMRLCGLMLDLLVIAALSRANPKPHQMENTHYMVVSFFSFLCLAWNVFCFVFIARHLFPNFWFERSLTLAGEALGHSYMGLLFARTMDPAMESPVPAAYAAKLLCFFIPSSGSKNTIVISLLSQHGPHAALLVCALVVATWFIIFESYFKNRLVKDNLPDKAPLLGGFDGNGARGASQADLRGSHAEHGLALNGGGFDDASDAMVSSLSYESYDQLDSAQKRDSGAELDVRGLDIDDLPGKRDKKAPSSPHNRRSSAGDLFASPDLSPECLQSMRANPNPNPNPECLQSMRVSTSDASFIVSPEQLRAVAAWCGDRQTTRTWTLKYSLRRDGASMDTMLGLCCMLDRSGRPTYRSVPKQGNCVALAVLYHVNSVESIFFLPIH